MARATDPKNRQKIGVMTDLMRRFIDEYTKDFHGAAAAVRAGYSANAARVTASKILAREDAQELLRTKMAKIEQKTEISATKVLEQAWGIVTADVNDLVEFRRRCCRHCYGIDFGYQRTAQEISRERASYNIARTKAIAKEPDAALTYEDFDEQGGPGYDARKAPNPDCTNCWGDGVGDAHFKPTASLSPEARALYAGVKQTKDGYQMLTIDKNAAMEKLFKHLGLYKEDNKQKADGLTDLIAFVSARGAKLPIKGND